MSRQGERRRKNKDKVERAVWEGEEDGKGKEERDK